MELRFIGTHREILKEMIAYVSDFADASGPAMAPPKEAQKEETRGRPAGVKDKVKRKERSDRKKADVGNVGASIASPPPASAGQPGDAPTSAPNAEPPAVTPAAPAPSAPAPSMPAPQSAPGGSAPATTLKEADVQAALAAYFEREGVEKALALLGQFGVKKVGMLKSEQYEDFVKAAK